jgi:hypothetical protein
MQQRISDWIGKFNIKVVPCEERPDQPAGDVVYRLKDLFTTASGQWDPSDKMGSLPQWARDAYLRPLNASDYFDDAGGDHNLFARVLDQDGKPINTQDLVIGWSDGFDLLGQPNFAQFISMRMTPKEKSGWANQPIWNKYWPKDGQRGAWCWCPQGASDVVWGGGLPEGNHVSIFAVWQAEPRGNGGDHGGDLPADVETLRRAAWQSVNRTYTGETAFVRYARSHNLGAPLGGETAAGAYLLQGFAGGIVYMQAGNEQSLQHVAW